MYSRDGYFFNCFTSATASPLTTYRLNAVSDRSVWFRSQFGYNWVLDTRNRLTKMADRVEMRVCLFLKYLVISRSVTVVITIISSSFISHQS